MVKSFEEIFSKRSLGFFNNKVSPRYLYSEARIEVVFGAAFKALGLIFNKNLNTSFLRNPKEFGWVI